MNTSNNHAEVTEVYKNAMGTLSIEMKLKGMRKTQEFTVYPIAEADKFMTIQSDTRIAKVSTEGKGFVSKSHASGAYFHHLQFDKLTLFEFSTEDWKKITELIKSTKSEKCGKKENGFISADNSGAKSIFNL